MRIINYTLKLIEGFPNRNAGLAVSMATSMATDHDIVAFIGIIIFIIFIIYILYILALLFIILLLFF